MQYRPILGLLILAVPVLLIWFLFRKSKGPRTGEANHDAWHGAPGGGTDGSDGSA